MYLVFFLFVLVNGVLSQMPVPGMCRQPPGAQFLHREQIQPLLGNYFEYARIPNPEEQGDCTTVILGMRDESAGTILNREILPNGQARQWSGLIYKTDDFHIIFDYGHAKFSSYVMAMDPTSHIIIYTCEDVPNSNMKKVGGWVLSRTKALSPQAHKDFIEILAENPDMAPEANWHYIKPNC